MKQRPRAARTSSNFYRNYLKFIILSIVFAHFSSAYAGSYEDFFDAVKRDDAAVVAQLLARGFDGNVRNPKGEHALHVAVREGASRVTDALLSWKGIDVEGRNGADESPLMLAALAGRLDVARRLLAMDADVNKPGWTPLHYAATRGHIDVMNLLLEKNAYIDAASPNGTTPLMMAAFYGTPSAVKLLLEAGADPLLRNQLGLTAIDFAQRANRSESADIIAAFVRARQPKGKW